jgi:hypothetical protein
MAHSRVMRFIKNDISARLEAEVANEVILTSDTHLNTGDLLSALRICFPIKDHQWMVCSLSGTRFLVLSPEIWRN